MNRRLTLAIAIVAAIVLAFTATWTSILFGADALDGLERVLGESGTALVRYSLPGIVLLGLVAKLVHDVRRRG